MTPPLGLDVGGDDREARRLRGGSVLPRRQRQPPCVCLVQGLEENLREAQGAAQRLESHLKQKEKLYEDKIKVKDEERTTSAEVEALDDDDLR